MAEKYKIDKLGSNISQIKTTKKQYLIHTNSSNLHFQALDFLMVKNQIIPAPEWNLKSKIISIVLAGL